MGLKATLGIKDEAKDEVNTEVNLEAQDKPEEEVHRVVPRDSVIQEVEEALFN